jgi:membrane-associated phospholipid phosphatase
MVCDPDVVLAAPARDRRPWRRAACWLLFLGPFFFLTYGTANLVASLRTDVGSVVFGWERHVPFLPWTIVPYWSIDAFYGLSLFMCTTRSELDTHGKRLLTAQIVAVACFLLVPLRFAFARPEIDGFAGFLFDSLTSFDKPFNQAPSLHIALLVILWPLYTRHVPGWGRWPLHVWFALVGISVLTTYQHHFIDVPTGVLLGFLCLWVWPEHDVSPLSRVVLTDDRQRRRMAARWTAAAAAMAGLAAAFGGVGLWLLWPSVSFTLVAANYAVVGAGGFQKRPDGSMSLGAQALLAPYLLAAWVNSRLWTRHDRPSIHVRDGVSLGRFPSRADAAGFDAVIDLCAELPGRSVGASSHAIPLLDLVTPTPEQLREAARRIEIARAKGTTLVCCALGYSRSAAAVASWLLATGRAATPDGAIAQVRAVRPRIVLGLATRQAIGAAARLET